MTPKPNNEMQAKEREFQLQQLRQIYDGALMAPKFRRRDQDSTQEDPGPPLIRYSDVMADRYIVRRGGEDWMNSFCDEETEILATYESLEELVDAGWRLD
jgi:hypothetical protein